MTKLSTINRILISSFQTGSHPTDNQKAPNAAAPKPNGSFNSTIHGLKSPGIPSFLFFLSHFFY
jgi:hypothetical protein